MTRKPCQGEAGFTLVESVLAIRILGFSLSACVISFTMSMQAVKTGPIKWPHCTPPATSWKPCGR